MTSKLCSPELKQEVIPSLLITDSTVQSPKELGRTLRKVHWRIPSNIPKCVCILKLFQMQKISLPKTFTLSDGIVSLTQFNL